MGDILFPSGFLWGSATSAHQVEGHNTNNDWWVWEQAGKVKEPSGLACDQYRRFREDFDLAKSLHHTAHRFSLEWSRIEPREGEFDETAIAHYREVIAALRERGLEPLVTLHHYTNPLWLANQGGWTNPKVVEAFARFTQRVVEALGDQVRYWLTINEPMVYAVMHYLDGVGPPGERNNVRLFVRVVEHLIRAHAVSSQLIHHVAKASRWDVRVSLANHAQPFPPCRPWWPIDRVAAGFAEHVYNQRFLKALVEGEWKFPGFPRVRIPEARGSLDFIGMNYYGRVFLRSSLVGSLWWGSRCSTRHHTNVTERNFLEWDVYPPGIRQILQWTVPYRLPVLITENGICTTDDAQRTRFILNHLRWVGRAVQEGVPVIGYLYWSLLDNFEWAHGYTPRFGLIEVDYSTQARRVRESARRFADVCRTNRLPDNP